MLFPYTESIILGEARQETRLGGSYKHPFMVTGQPDTFVLFQQPHDYCEAAADSSSAAKKIQRKTEKNWVKYEFYKA